MRHPRLARFAVMLVAAATLLPLFAAPAAADIETVSGTVVLNERIALSPAAVLVVTIGDRSPGGSGTIIAQQRIDGATANEAFSVPYDTSVINAKHAYSLYASLIDGGTEWQSLLPIPVITGGPTEGLAVEVVSRSYTNPATIDGTISLPAETLLTPSAVAYAVITNTTTGRVAARQVIPSPAAVPIAFSIGYDADLVDPNATYVIGGALIDGSTLWQTESPTEVHPGDTPSLTLVQQDTTIPGASPLPTAVPPTAPPPTAPPSGQPSAEPTQTPEITATPTQEITPGPTEEVTPAPTEEVTPEPTEAPTATPELTPEPTTTPVPTALPTTVSGTVIYKEPAQLSNDAVLTVVVVQRLAGGRTITVVGKERVDGPGQQPIAFSVTLDQAVLDPDSEAQLWASLVDGTNVWTSAKGISVATQGAPSEGVIVPLAFRPDLIEGEVTGAITGLPSTLLYDSWAMAWVENPADGTILGLTTGPIYGSTFIPFEVPFLITDVDPGATYLAEAAVFADVNQWESQAGVPVITGGNPFTGIEIAVVQTAPTPTPSTAPTPAPTATATTAPSATASPPPSETGGGVDWTLILIVVIIVVIVGGAILLIVMR